MLTEYGIEIDIEELSGVAYFDVYWMESLDGDIGGVDGWEVDYCKLHRFSTFGKSFDRDAIMSVVGKETVLEWEKYAMECVPND